MNDVNQTTPATIPAEEPDAVPENPAVARCMKAWFRAFREAKAKNKSEYESEKVAIQAYRDAMPSPAGYDNIRDFIACVVRGMLVHIINGEESTKLLYAAQVAYGMVLRQSVPRKPTSTA
jgi:hypothetical protein